MIIRTASVEGESFYAEWCGRLGYDFQYEMEQSIHTVTGNESAIDYLLSGVNSTTDLNLDTSQVIATILDGTMGIVQPTDDPENLLLVDTDGHQMPYWIDEVDDYVALLEGAKLRLAGDSSRRLTPSTSEASPQTSAQKAD